MPSHAVPHRLAWTVDHLEVEPGQRILEIGCGRGVAAELVCSRLAHGRYVGIDRSPLAVRAANARAHEYVERGSARFQQVALEDVDPAVLGTFHAVFAVNVNLFWTGPAERELDQLCRLLADGGRLWLTYESPASSVDPRLRDLLAEHLTEAGWTHRLTTDEASGAALLGVLARPGAAW